MQMIFENLAGGEGGEETLAMVYEALRHEGIPGVEIADNVRKISVVLLVLALSILVAAAAVRILAVTEISLKDAPLHNSYIVVNVNAADREIRLLHKRMNAHHVENKKGNFACRVDPCYLRARCAVVCPCILGVFKNALCADKLLKFLAADINVFRRVAIASDLSCGGGANELKPAVIFQHFPSDGGLAHRRGTCYN
jgi:hypothetical protein